MDYDLAGTEAAKKFSEKLGHKRCGIINPETLETENLPKDANEALKSFTQSQITQLFENA